MTVTIKFMGGGWRQVLIYAVQKDSTFSRVKTSQPLYSSVVIELSIFSDCAVDFSTSEVELLYSSLNPHTNSRKVSTNPVDSVLLRIILRMMRPRQPGLLCRG